MVKKVGKYEIGRTLGEGTFGKVKFAKNTETEEHVAIKILDKEKIQKQNMGSQIKKEISIMKMVRNDHVVTLREVLASRTKIFIVLELITGGELFDEIVRDSRFEEPKARKYFRQLIDGVGYCHANKVCHRDLKPENLLLDENKNLKISDFGLSALYGGGEGEESKTAQLLHTTCGTPNYVAPEVLKDEGYNGYAADIWSCGVILYVLLAGFLPFDEPTMSSLFKKIQKCEYSFPTWFSPSARDILGKILVGSPDERITIDEIRSHVWYTDGQQDEEEEVAEPVAVVAAASVDAAEDFEKNAIKDEGDDNIEEDDPEPLEPKRMNAFDLINRCGSVALKRMFSSVSEKGRNRLVNYTTHIEIRKALEALITICNQLDCKVDVSEEDLKRGYFTSEHMTNRGMITMNVQMYTMCEGLNLIELRKGRGDIAAYNSFFEAFQTELDTKGIVYQHVAKS